MLDSVDEYCVCCAQRSLLAIIAEAGCRKGREMASGSLMNSAGPPIATDGLCGLVNASRDALSTESTARGTAAKEACANCTACTEHADAA